MSRAISTANAEHYKWGDQCDGWHLLRSEDLPIIEERTPPGSRETRHHHLRARQFFCVLEGTLTMDVEGVEHALETGQGI